MSAWMHRRIGLVGSLFLILRLIAPLAPAATAQDAPSADTPVELTESATPEPESSAPEPAGPPAPEEPVAPEEPPPAATEPPAADDVAEEPDAVPSEPSVEPTSAPAETPVPTTELAAADATGTEVPGSSVAEPAPSTSETDALAVESTLTVAVTDAVTAAPIAGAAVVVYDTGWTQVTSGSTDAAGIAVFGDIAEGEYHLAVTANGYADGSLNYQWVSGPTDLSIALQPLPPPGALTIHVMDQESGAAIAGATVVVRSYWTGNEVATGTTAEDGTFVTSELAGGEYNVSVTAAQYLDGSFFAQVNGPVELTAPLQLAPLPGILTIHVVDQATDAPIADATVTVRDMSWTAVAAGATDANGAFVTGELAAGWHVVEVSADAYLGSSDYVMIDGAVERTYALQLAPLPGTLEVTVVDVVTGEPVAGATVTITWPIFLSGTTDDAGVFLTQELASGNYWVEVSATGYLGASAFVTVDGNLQLTIDLEPILPGALTTYVTDQETGAPVPNATVTVREYWTGIETVGYTGADGAFVTGELPGGQYQVTISSEHYVTGYASTFINGPTEVSVGILARFPGTVTVTALDAVSGQPIAGATVNVLDWDSTVLASGVTDTNGVVVSPEVRGGNTWLSLTAQGYESGYAYLWLSGPTEYTFQLAPLAAGDLTVTVREQWAWTPIGGATVVVRDASGDAEVASGVTDANGNYVASGLPGGSYDIEVTGAGYFPASGQATVNGSGWVTIEMQPQVDGILTVAAVDGPTGQAISAASVIVTDPDGNEVAAGTTGDDGAFSTGTLTGGWYDVAVTAAGYQPAETQAFVSGDSQVSVGLQPTPGTLMILAVDQLTGEPVAGATVMVSDFSSVIATGTTDANGEFFAGMLEPREYYVEVTADDYFWAIDRPIVRGDTVFTMALEPRVEGTLTVLVTDQVTGEPIHKAQVVVEGMSQSTGTTDSKGVFVTATLPGDWYRVTVRADGYDPGSGVRHVLVSGPTEVTVELEPQAPGVLTITVVDLFSGEPVAAATVEVRNYDTWMIVGSGETKKSGVFTTKELPGGDYFIQVAAEGYFTTGDRSAWVSGDSAVTIWMYPRLPSVLTVTTFDQVTGAPIAGATVVVTDLVDGTQVAAGATDTNGVFTTGTLGAGEYLVEATADGYLPRGEYTYINGDTGLTLPLEQAVPGTLTVSVMDQISWQPMPGASVNVRDAWTGDIVASGVTDADGSFVTPELPAGEYTVGAGAEGYVLTGNAWVRISGPAHVTLWMEPGEPGALTVYVYDERTGTMIAGATVVVRDGGGAEVATGTTDGEGAFVTGELATGTYSIDVTADRYHQTVYHYAIVNGPNRVWLGMILRTEATLVLSVDVGTPGVDVTVEGSGFQPGETVTIMWRDPDGTMLTTMKAKSDGTIATSFTIPDTYPSWHRVLAVGQESGVIGAANLTVIVPETP